MLFGFVVALLVVASAIHAWAAGKEWWQPVNALGTLIVGTCVAYVAYQQLATNREKLRLDLYGRRFELYWSILEVLNSQFAHGHLEEGDFREFYRRIQESRFLFPPDVEGFLIEMREKARDQQFHKHRLAEKPGTEEGSESATALQDLGTWFENKPNEMHQLFGRYMRIRF